jgi:hypothetical protein
LKPGPQTNLFKDNGGRGMPKRTFKDRLTLGRGAEQTPRTPQGRNLAENLHVELLTKRAIIVPNTRRNGWKHAGSSPLDA